MAKRRTRREIPYQMIDGNRAAALGAKLSRVQVVAAYPITPQTPVTEALSEFVERGELHAQYVTVESEHSALAVCSSASLVGARTFTATSSHGLAYMHEMLHWVAGTRLPVVLACVNRAIGAPWNVLNDQQDSVSQRDTGWVQTYARNNQEILDSVIQAYKIAEKTYLPVMVCYDGYVLSHTEMPVDVPLQDVVDRFLPSYKPHTTIDPGNPKNYNLVTLANPRVNTANMLCHGYMEIRYLLQEAMERSIETITGVGREFGDSFGRSYAGLLWEDIMQDAEVAIVAMGSLGMEAILAANALRKEGVKAGVVGLRIFRPFPKRDLVRALGRCRLVLVFDKSVSYGNEGAMCNEIKAALYRSGAEAAVHSFVVGLGGRDVKARELVDAVKKTLLSLDRGTLNDEKAEWICEI